MEIRPCGTKHLEVEELTAITITFEENQDGKCQVYCNLPTSDTLRVFLQLRLPLLLEDMFLLIPLTILTQQLCRHRRPEFSQIANVFNKQFKTQKFSEGQTPQSL